MKITLLVVSKTDDKYLQEGIAVYLKRLTHYIPFDIDVIPALKDQKNASPDDIKEREGALILKKIEKSDAVILLDEHGTQYTSVGFSDFIQKQMNRGIRQLTFVIGGAFGFSPAVYKAATGKISLSTMTFNHQMVRLIFVEQLYRAFTILHHEPYHNE